MTMTAKMFLSCTMALVVLATTSPMVQAFAPILTGRATTRSMEENDATTISASSLNKATITSTTTLLQMSSNGQRGAVQSFVNRASSLLPSYQKNKGSNRRSSASRSSNNNSNYRSSTRDTLRRVVQNQARRMSGTNVGVALNEALRSNRKLAGGWLTAAQAWQLLDEWNEAPDNTFRDRTGLARPADLFSTTSRATHWQVLKYNIQEMEFWEQTVWEAADNQRAAAAQLQQFERALRNIENDGPAGGSYDDIEDWQDLVAEAQDNVQLAENVAISTQAQADEAILKLTRQVSTVQTTLEDRLGPLEDVLGNGNNNLGGGYYSMSNYLDYDDDDDDDYAPPPRRRRESNGQRRQAKLVNDFDDDENYGRQRQTSSPPRQQRQLPPPTRRMNNNNNINRYVDNQDWSKLLAKLDSAFPGAQTNAELVAKTNQLLRKFGYGSDTLLAFSLCCDEVNRPLEDEFETVYGSAFNMGGLAGFPFGGVTSFGAMAKHIPDGGSCLLVYGPHVGVNGDGKVGTVDRRGKKEGGACCGSAVAASGAVTAPPAKKSVLPSFKAPPPIATEDAQQTFVTNMLRPYASNLKKADDSMVELPYSLFDAVDELTNKILSKASTYVSGPGKIALLGGIQINTPDGMSDYFLPLRFEVRDNANNLVEDLLFVNRFNSA